MNPVTILRQPWAATLALGLCMWAQIPHSQHVFEHWAKDQSGWAFAWGFEAAVLMFVVRNMHGASWTFASLSALINVGYYGLQSVDMWAWPNEDNWLSWLLSLALPFTIAMYSHVLADVQEGAAWHLPDWAVRRIWNAPMWLTPVLALILPTVQPAIEGVQPSAMPTAAPMHPVQKCVEVPVQFDDKDAQPEPRTVAAQLRSEGLSIAQISEQLNVHRNTVGKWLRSAA